jgi:hypothetical protein
LFGKRLKSFEHTRRTDKGTIQVLLLHFLCIEYRKPWLTEFSVRDKNIQTRQARLKGTIQERLLHCFKFVLQCHG